MPQAWMGPLPPKANRTASLKSRPRSVETARTARIMVASANRWTP